MNQLLSDFIKNPDALLYMAIYGSVFPVLFVYAHYKIVMSFRKHTDLDAQELRELLPYYRIFNAIHQYSQTSLGTQMVSNRRSMRLNIDEYWSTIVTVALLYFLMCIGFYYFQHHIMLLCAFAAIYLMIRGISGLIAFCRIRTVAKNDVYRKLSE